MLLGPMPSTLWDHIDNRSSEPARHPSVASKAFQSQCVSAAGNLEVEPQKLSQGAPLGITPVISPANSEIPMCLHSHTNGINPPQLDTCQPNNARSPVCETTPERAESSIRKATKHVKTLFLREKSKETASMPTWPNPEVSIGAKCNSLGNYDCWEADGPAKEAYLQIAERIVELLSARMEDLDKGNV